jgi:NAD-dependent dihydropyrimidine dehydrogenase PreA subunit
VRDSDFAGKYRIVYFGYTYCPDVCPTDMAKIGQAMKALDKRAPRKSREDRADLHHRRSRARYARGGQCSSCAISTIRGSSA